MNAKGIFEILLRDNAAMLLIYIRGLVNGLAVDDLFQETCITAWRKLDSFDTTRPIGPWLRGIAKHHAFNHYRKYQREYLIDNDQALDYLEQQIHRIDQREGDCWADKVIDLHHCIDQLPQSYQLAVKLRFLAEEQASSLRERLDLSQEALKKRLQRAKTQLLNCLNQRGLLNLESRHD